MLSNKSWMIKPQFSNENIKAVFSLRSFKTDGEIGRKAFAKKVGFNSSVDSIFNTENKKIKNFLFDEKSEIYNIVDRNKFIELFQIKSKPNYISKFIFNCFTIFFNFCLFL